MATIPINNNLSPEERLKCLITYVSSVEIDPNVSAKLYYKSGLNMFKQFNIYYKECSWENALCLYRKYELLFFDKIKKHPDYSKIPLNIKSVNATNFRLMKNKAEHARRELFKQYKREYMSYCDELKKLQEDELLQGIIAKQTTTATQTKPRVGSHDFNKLAKSPSDLKNANQLFRSKNNSIKSNNLNFTNQKVTRNSQEAKTNKGGEVSSSTATSLKGNELNNTQERVSASFQQPKFGEALQKNSLKGYDSLPSKVGSRKSSKADSEVFRSINTSLKANSIGYETFSESRQIEFIEAIHNLDRIQKGTQMTSNGTKEWARKKNKDQPLDGKNGFKSSLSNKSSLKSYDERETTKHQRFGSV